jgi:hypothetical protein
MTRGHFRHLPVCGDSGLAGIIDITESANQQENCETPEDRK